MRRKPLKISWHTWCLYKLAKQDFSEWELRTAMLKRAAEADQPVDPDPVIRQLKSENLLDDDRYVQNKIRIQLEVYQKKGPRGLKFELEKKRGIDPAVIERHLHENDAEWLTVAGIVRDKVLREKGIAVDRTSEVPVKLYAKIKRKLYRDGFTEAQIHQVMAVLKPVANLDENPDRHQIEMLVQKRMESGKGPRDIRQVLLQKGIPDMQIRDFLDVPDEVWIDIAIRERRKKFGDAFPVAGKDKKQQIDFLLRRGFLFEHAKAAIRTNHQ